MKKCPDCKENLPLSAFYKNSSLSDGHFSKCKQCTKRAANENRLKNIDRYREYDRIRGALPSRVAIMKEYSSTDEYKKSHSAANNLYRANNRRKLRAHNAVNKAIASGNLKPWEGCAIQDCIDTKIEAHHPDYDRPLDVVWLCGTHHKMLHKEFRSSERVRVISASRGISSP